VDPTLTLGLPPPESLPPARRLFVIGDRDQFTRPDALGAYAAAAGGSLLVLPGSDHFFFGREHRVAQALAAHLAPASG
jgi:alpha/beta superfamily hydrolase